MIQITLFHVFCHHCLWPYSHDDQVIYTTVSTNLESLWWSRLVTDLSKHFSLCGRCLFGYIYANTVFRHTWNLILSNLTKLHSYIKMWTFNLQYNFICVNVGDHPENPGYNRKCREALIFCWYIYMHFIYSIMWDYLLAGNKSYLPLTNKENRVLCTQFVT